MLDRYTLTPMGELWSPQNRLNTWAGVAIAQAVARAKSNRADLHTELLEYPIPTAEEVAKQETHTRHDVAAFLQVYRSKMVPSHAQLIHLGLTSSDLVDTANAVILRQASNVIVDAVNRLAIDLAKRSLRHWHLERLGRTHGQIAEITRFGYQLARHAAALVIGGHRFNSACEDVSLVKMSGPVGTYRMTSIDDERRLAKLVGPDFEAVEVAGQRVPREGYARWVSELAILATSVEDLALQVRIGQQAGIGELAEGFGPSQVGSSSMPHKQNPIMSETMTGLARIVRAQIVPVMEGIPTWGERDITHSSVERIALPTASILTHYLLVVGSNLVRDLQVNAGRIDQNLVRAGEQAWSAYYKSVVVQAGVTPERADQVIRVAIGENLVDETLDDVTGNGTPVPPAPGIHHALRLMEEIANG